MNVETNFLAKVRQQPVKRLAGASVQLPIVADMDSALEMADYEPFWLVATPIRPVLSCGRVGIEFHLPCNTGTQGEESLVTWISAEGQETATVLAAARRIGDRAIPVSRSRAGFHASFAALNAA